MLAYSVHHRKNQKLTVAKTLLSRVNTDISDKAMHSELQNIRTQYLATTLVFYQKHFSNFYTATLSENTIQLFHFYSFIHGTSEKVRRILNEAGMKVAKKPVNTIGVTLPLPKAPLSLEKKVD